jgi:PAS domain S-box-containing protein
VGRRSRVWAAWSCGAGSVVRDNRPRSRAELSQDASFTLDRDGLLASWSPGAEALYGYKHDEIVGEDVTLLAFEPDWATVRASVAEVLEGRRIWNRRLLRRRRDGSAVEVIVSACPHMIDGEIVGVLATVRAVADRSQAIAASRESERWLRTLFDAAPDAIVVMDDDRRVVDLNSAACTLAGLAREDLLGHRADALVPTGIEPGLDPPWPASLRRGREAAGQAEIVAADGSRREVEMTAAASFMPGRHVAVLRDVTARRQLERQLVRVQKMDSIGRLASGLAHNLRNDFLAITGYCQLAHSALDRGALDHDALSEIEHAVASANALVDSVLSLGREREERRLTLSLNQLCRGVIARLDRMLGEDSVLEHALSERELTIVADPAVLEHALVDVAVNARDSMPPGGRIRLATDVETLTAANDLALPAGVYASVSIEDDGTGMEPEVAEHAFEPFFSTKGELGTGLGLANAWAACTRAGGGIRLLTAPGTGTTITMLLPLSRTGGAEVADVPVSDVRGTEGTVLVVVDDSRLRSVLEELLQGSGYRALLVAGYEDAEALLFDGREHVDVALVDLATPGADGVELASRLRRLGVEAALVFITGRAPAPDDAELGSEGLLLRKPFTSEALLRVVREAAASDPPAGR